ncbi:YebG family protein [Rahnella sp. PD12R]|uniref:YebG family protein n=1 Tax=Rahnella sp. PD12R TaxID=2855688 RepID=UPI001C48EAC8|nr:YebG family protein [Rahnella sp. PD12R]MBV6818067.1 YebG family protein [Rahnella sp. PD12R]
MAVETKFVVVRKGEEKMTFANKKDADAYDKMLDMADTFTEWLSQSGLEIDEVLAENIALHLAEQKDAVQHILRTSKMPEAAAVVVQETAEETAEPDNAEVVEAEAEEKAAPAPKKARAVKAA